MLFDSDLLEHIRLVSSAGVTSDDDRVIADLLHLHPEFDSLWNDSAIDPTRPQEIGGDMVNPFVHIALHLIIGKQIRQGMPAQVKKAYLHLVERGGYLSGYDAEATLRRSDFGIRTYPSMIGDRIHLYISIEGIRTKK